MSSSSDTYIDQLARQVVIFRPLKSIISIVPSQTELLFYLGLNEEIVGITKFCVHPKEKIKQKIKIGGTKNLNIEKIRQLKPDLIIVNKEENNEEQVNELMKEFPVWMSDIKSLDDTYDMIEKLGIIVGKQHESKKLINEIQLQFDGLKNKLKSTLGDKPLKTIYLIWRNPYMTIGADTFINSMLQLAGFRNCYENKLRYPEISEVDLEMANPQLILLSSEPYPFKEKHIEELQHICPNAQITSVDGEMFSWYGSRLLLSAAYFEKLVNEIKAT